MLTVKTWSGLAVVATALLLAAGTPLRAAEGSAAPVPAPSGITFVMPAAGAFIPGGAVVVAGFLPPGASWVNLLLDGEPVADVQREGRSFSATLTPAPGRRELEARAGDLAATLVFTYGRGGDGSSPYRYHKPVLEGRCAECHAGVRRQAARAESETCKSCHRSLAVVYPYLHGPLAAGKCLVCHEAHGSSWPALTKTDARTMCVSCHDQPSTMDHVDQARSRVCHLCHNPHASMNRRFLYDIVK